LSTYINSNMRIFGFILIIFSFLNVSDNTKSTDQICVPTEVDRLGIEILIRINPLSIKKDFEYGGTIYLKPNGKLDATPPRTDDSSHCVNIPTLRMLHIKGHTLARYHTHAAYSNGAYIDEEFSEVDTSEVNVDQYLITPDWKILKFDGKNRRVYKFDAASDAWFIVPVKPPKPSEEYFPLIPKLELYYKLPWLYNPNYINF